MTDAGSVKVWLITGCSSGFGKRLAVSVASRGDLVLATARSLEKLEAVLSAVPSELRERIHPFQLDICEDEEVIKRKVDECIKVWGRVDVLVNNAGYGLPGLIEEGGSRRMELQFKTNVFGVLNVTNAVLPHMRAGKSGTVVTIGSRMHWKSELPSIGFYSASKAAVHAFTETLMTELAPLNIRVLLVAPGAFRTEGIYGERFDESNTFSDYDDLRTKCKARFNSIAGTEKGDPAKAAEAIVDVVRGEGVAKGRSWPNYLILGEDAEADVRAKSSKILSLLDEWADVTRGVSFDEGS